MSPRLLIPLSMVVAAAGFECVRFLDAGKNLASSAVAASDSANGDSGSCESCKNTPTNRFSLLASRQAAGGETPADAGAILTKEGSADFTGESISRLSKRWAKRERLANASAEALEEEIQKTKVHPFRMEKDGDFLFAVRRFAELNPERAADLWAKNGEFRAQPDLFLGAWIKKDPAAFVSWNLNQTGDVQKASATALGNMARESPQKFAEMATQLSGSPAGAAAARSAIQGMREAEKDNPQKALEYAQALPEGTLRNAALVELLSWPEAKATNHPEALAAVKQLEPEDARRLGRELGTVAAELPVGVARESAFAASSRQQAGKDPAAAAKALDGLAGSGDYPAAVRGFVEETARKDPAGAAEWAVSIPESASLQRMSALERVAAAWFKSAPDEARAWVETARITDAEYFKLTGRARQRQ